MSRTGRGGLTIIELTVVVVLVAVLATMIVPRLYGATKSAALRESATRLASVARYARDTAARQHTACRLALDIEQNRFALLVQSDPSRDPARFEPLQTGIGKPRSLGEGLKFARVCVAARPRLDGIPEAADSVTFYADGAADAAAVQISDGTRTWTLLVAPSSGQCRIVEEAVDEPLSDRKDLDE